MIAFGAAGGAYDVLTGPGLRTVFAVFFVLGLRPRGPRRAPRAPASRSSSCRRSSTSSLALTASAVEGWGGSGSFLQGQLLELATRIVLGRARAGVRLPDDAARRRAARRRALSLIRDRGPPAQLSVMPLAAQVAPQLGRQREQQVLLRRLDLRDVAVARASASQCHDLLDERLGHRRAAGQADRRHAVEPAPRRSRRRRRRGGRRARRRRARPRRGAPSSSCCASRRPARGRTRRRSPSRRPGGSAWRSRCRPTAVPAAAGSAGAAPRPSRSSRRPTASSATGRRPSRGRAPAPARPPRRRRRGGCAPAPDRWSRRPPRDPRGR